VVEERATCQDKSKRGYQQHCTTQWPLSIAENNTTTNDIHEGHKTRWTRRRTFVSGELQNMGKGKVQKVFAQTTINIPQSAMDWFLKVEREGKVVTLASGIVCIGFYLGASSFAKRLVCWLRKLISENDLDCHLLIFNLSKSCSLGNKHSLVI